MTTTLKRYPTPGGHTVLMAYRTDTADEPVISGTSIADEYGVANLKLEPGDVVVDIGAYIGSVAFAVAADFPEVRVVMVEAIPENCEVIKESIEANGWGDRMFVYNASASHKKGQTDVGYGAGPEDNNYQKDNRFVGGLKSLNYSQTATLPNLSLTAIVKQYGEVAWLKIDCEGCEYDFLDDPAVKRVKAFAGEWHDGGMDDIIRMLGKTHDVTFTNVENVVGLFEAKRR
jgi:FkbM family methyltransferase